MKGSEPHEIKCISNGKQASRKYSLFLN